MYRDGGVALIVALAVAIFTPCEEVLAFQQKNPAQVNIEPIPVTAVNNGKRSSTLSALERNLLSRNISEQNCGNDDHDTLSFRSDGNGNGADSRALSRRKAITGVLSLATIASLSPPMESLASPIEEASPPNSAKPFRVLFRIQVDSQKPDDLSELEVEVRPDWAPLAAERFRNLIELGFYKDAPFFRVLPGYVAQFGISSDPNLNKQWVYCDPTDKDATRNCKPSLPDEPRTQPNKRGTLSFASSGKNSRKTQVFINLSNNDGPPNFLDVQNFVPFARIVRGMESENNIPKRLNSEYGGKVNQGKAAYYGGEYFQAVFPKLSVIRNAQIL